MHLSKEHNQKHQKYADSIVMRLNFKCVKMYTEGYGFLKNVPFESMLQPDKTFLHNSSWSVAKNREKSNQRKEQESAAST